jgi:molybdate transport system substrate-binding protein
VGLVALSQVMSLPEAERGYWIAVPDDMHEPIRQDAALTVRGSSNEAARAFLAYLKGRDAQAIMTGLGYVTENQ